jgi:hypothetical protein
VERALISTFSTFRKGGAKTTVEKGGAKTTVEKGGAKTTVEKGGAKCFALVSKTRAKQ